MAAVTSTMSATRIVSNNRRCVYLINASGVSGDAIVGHRSITLGVTASAFGDDTGDSAITAGTAKLGAIYASMGNGGNNATNFAYFSIASGSTGIHTNSADKTNLMFQLRGAVGIDDYIHPRYSIRQTLSEGKVTVTLDNMLANNSSSYAYGSMIVEFTN